MEVEPGDTQQQKHTSLTPLGFGGDGNQQAMQMHMPIARKKDSRKPTVVRMSVSWLQFSRPAKEHVVFASADAYTMP